MEDPPLQKLPELLALLTHDLRNPLAALLANLNFIGSVVGEDGTDTALALVDAKAACSMLDQLIANVNIFAAALRSSPSARQPVSLREAAIAAISRHRVEALALGIEVELSGNEGSPRAVLVEPSLFGCAIDNLLANALQYTPERGAIRVELDLGEDWGVVAILDGGPVVPIDLRGEVLTAAGQSRAKQTRDGRYGRGLGLYCAARAAVLSGARVTIGERDGSSVFELSAPIIAER